MELKYAYLAGVIDSDGFITIERTKKNKTLPSGNMSTSIYHFLKVGISGTNSSVHYFAQKIFGGSVSEYSPKNKNHLNQFQWNLSNNLAKNFLIKIEPYLVIKKERALIGIGFQTLIEEQKIKRANLFGERISDEMRAERDIYWEKLVKLNNARNKLRSITNKKKSGLLDGVLHDEYPDNRKNNG